MALHRGQGSFEYILMLSGVLLVVITMVYMLQGTASGADTTLEAQMKSAGVALDPSFYTPGAKPQFMPSSPADGAGSTDRPNITAVITVKDATLTGVNFNWNGVNYSVYDPSLVLALDFDDENLAGDTASKSIDLSMQGNNGTIYGNTAVLFHMDENSSTTLYDESRFKNDGTVSGAAWASGKSGSGLQFDGVDDYASLGTAVSLTPKYTLTIESWVKFNNFSVSNGWVKSIYSKGSESANKTVWLGYGNSSGTTVWYWEVGNGSNIGVGWFPDTLNTGQWYHIVATFSPGNVKLYKDGTLFRSTAVNVGSLDTTGFTGYLGRYSGGSHCFNGTLDEFAIFNRTLDAAEVAQRYAQGRARHADWNADGKWDSSMRFDGYDDYVNRTSVPGLSTSALTYSFWSKQAGTSTQFMHLMGIFGNHQTTVYVSPGGYSYAYKFNNISGTKYESSIQTLDGNWHNIAATYDGARIMVYADAVLKVNLSAPGYINKSDDSVFVGTTGTGSTPAGNYFNGSMDEVRIWNRALSPAEIEINYRSNLRKFTPNAWFFDFRNDSMAYGTYNYTIYTNGGYKKDGASETRTVKYCQLPVPC